MYHFHARTIEADGGQNKAVRQHRGPAHHRYAILPSSIANNTNYHKPSLTENQDLRTATLIPAISNPMTGYISAPCGSWPRGLPFPAILLMRRSYFRYHVVGDSVGENEQGGYIGTTYCLCWVQSGECRLRVLCLERVER